jgi:hypothetical protein
MDKEVRFGVAGLSREGMTAVDNAIQGNAKKYGFKVEDDTIESATVANGDPR